MRAWLKMALSGEHLIQRCGGGWSAQPAALWHFMMVSSSPEHEANQSNPDHRFTTLG
jgi:hypothetical protein